MNLLEELFNLTRPEPLTPPRENGKTAQMASPDGILNGKQLKYAKKIDPSSVPMGNHWYGNRKRDHGYRGHESLTETVF